jgi:hypothetical protein
MLRKLSVCTAIVLPIAMLSVSPLKAQAQSQTAVLIPCSNLRGAGSFNNPLVIGVVNRPVRITNCPRLQSGSASLVSRYFRFSLQFPASTGSFVASGANLVPGAISAVHPNVSSPAGFRLRTSAANGSWIGDPNRLGLVWRLVPLANLPASTYVLGVEKQDSPLRSLQTPNFDIVINP